MATTSPHRRRQRSVRVTVAVALLVIAALVVILALPTQSPVWLSVSSVVALLAGAVSSRIVYTELLQSRRENALDRASQAQAYRSLFAERAVEHAEFTTSMTDRLVSRDRSINELEGTIVLAEQRAIEAERRVQREARRANEAAEQVAELQDQLSRLEIRKAEEADELASWEGWGEQVRFDGDADTIVNLMAWDERSRNATEAAAAAAAAEQKQA